MGVSVVVICEKYMYASYETYADVRNKKVWSEIHMLFD